MPPSVDCCAVKTIVEWLQSAQKSEGNGDSQANSRSSRCRPTGAIRCAQAPDSPLREAPALCGAVGFPGNPGGSDPLWREGFGGDSLHQRFIAASGAKGGALARCSGCSSKANRRKRCGSPSSSNGATPGETRRPSAHEVAANGAGSSFNDRSDVDGAQPRLNQPEPAA